MANFAENKRKESSPILVKAGDIAKALSVSLRQVGYWAEEGRIPCHRLGKRCVRYSLPEVLQALEIETSST
jgi:DNA-binding transcriptional MerR regulator